MYPSYIQRYDTDPYYQQVYFSPTPVQDLNHYYASLDGRIFGGFPPMGPPQGMPGFPSMGPQQGVPGSPPMGPPQGVPGFPPSGQGAEAGAPTSPPPSFVPTQTQQQAEAFAVDPGSIRRCLFRFTYVWLRGFEQFWFYPTFIGRTSVSGYRWTGFRWVFFGISLRQIQSFTCV